MRGYAIGMRYASCSLRLRQPCQNVYEGRDDRMQDQHRRSLRQRVRTSLANDQPNRSTGFRRRILQWLRRLLYTGPSRDARSSWSTRRAWSSRYAWSTGESREAAEFSMRTNSPSSMFAVPSRPSWTARTTWTTGKSRTYRRTWKSR